MPNFDQNVSTSGSGSCLRFAISSAESIADHLRTNTSVKKLPRVNRKCRKFATENWQLFPRVTVRFRWFKRGWDTPPKSISDYCRYIYLFGRYELPKCANFQTYRRSPVFFGRKKAPNCDSGVPKVIIQHDFKNKLPFVVMEGGESTKWTLLRN